jgi:hypothetical protein
MIDKVDTGRNVVNNHENVTAFEGLTKRSCNRPAVPIESSQR